MKKSNEISLLSFCRDSIPDGLEEVPTSFLRCVVKYNCINKERQASDMGVVENILLGAMGSIVATIVLYCCSALYKIGYKEELKFHLEAAMVSVLQIENIHTYPEDYGIVVSQTDNILQHSFAMYKCIKPLSLWWNPKSKQLIITLLYEIISLCEKVKYTTVGYSGIDEREARLHRIEDYFYKYPYLRESNCSTIRVQLGLIDSLLKTRTIYGGLMDAFGRLSHQIPLEDITIDGFIDINSFSQKSDRDMRRRGITKRGLEKTLRRSAQIAEILRKRKKG